MVMMMVTVAKIKDKITFEIIDMLSKTVYGYFHDKRGGQRHMAFDITISENGRFRIRKPRPIGKDGYEEECRKYERRENLSYEQLQEAFATGESLA